MKKRKGRLLNVENAEKSFSVKILVCQNEFIVIKFVEMFLLFWNGFECENGNAKEFKLIEIKMKSLFHCILSIRFLFDSDK